MAKSRSRWLVLILVPVGLLLVAILGMWAYMSTTAPLHPDLNDVPSVAYSAPSPEWRSSVEQARQIVRAHISGQNVPGLSVAVGIGGEVVWAEGFGFADLRTGIPVTPNHRFRIGTASTVLTSVAAGLLLEDGRLDLEREIQTYVPAFPRKEWPVTLRQLMGHTAGIIPDSGDEGPLFGTHCEQLVEALPHFAGKPLLFQPGTQYRYSDYGWILVSAAIEAAAGRPFLKFIQERVFDPLHMRETIPDSETMEGEDFPLFILIRENIFDPGTRPGPVSDAARRSMQDRATSYFPRFAADPNYGLHVMRLLDLSCYAGASVFLSTPSDLVRFGMAMDGGTLLRPATVRSLQTSQQLTSGKYTDYGLGWDNQTVTLAGKRTRMVGHNGELLGGMAASLMTFPEHGIVVSAISNISYAGTSSLAVRIAEAFEENRNSPAGK